MGAAPLTEARLEAIARSGIRVPDYDRRTLEPRIVHVGVGGFMRSHLAQYTDAVADGGWGIGGLGLRAEDGVIAAALAGQEHLYTLVEKGTGAPSAAVIGALLDVRHAPPGDDAGAAARIASPTTAILSLTITEAGYGEPTDADMAACTPTTFDRLALALRARRDAGAGALTVLSLDNIPGNGAVTRSAMLAAAARLDAGLPAWVQEHCTFPSSMVDRITPATTDADRAWLREAHGLEDAWPVVAEPFRQWVLEDDFAAGRPAWERDGALFSDRVHDWELYKLRLLNAAHSSMAYLSALAGITYVDEAMDTPAMRAFLVELLHAEALPTLDEIPGHPRDAYVATVLERFESTGIRDQVHRLCLDGSAKFPVFLVPTVTRQLERGGPIACAATALAGWARYLAVVEPAQQAHDATGDVARAHAARATAEPRAFLELAQVFPPALREDARFVAAFVDAYHRIVEDGPLAACLAASDRPPTEVPR